MKIKNNIAKAAVAAGLSIAMTLSGIAPATMAWAADATAADSTITISNVDGNQTSFKGYQIFSATVADGPDGKSVSNVAWANYKVKDAVEGVINANDTAYAGTTAQDAADWIKEHVTGTTKETAVASDSVAEAIAKAVMGLTSTTTVAGGTASAALDPGYWLFVTDSSTVDNGTTESPKNTETYTSPIFAVVGGSAYTVTEKASVPTVEKKIVSDADGREYDAADSHMGQDVTYDIYGTVAQDFATYGSYSYAFTDNVSKGLTVDAGSVKVYMYSSKDAAKADLSHAAGTDVTSHFETALGDAKDDGSRDLTVTASDAKGLRSIEGATADSCFVVTYTAKVNSDAVIGNAGNPNTVTLTYSNNPNAEGTGTTVPDTVRDFTYALNLVKLDQGTERGLAGAEFAIKVESADDAASIGKWVQQDGTLGTEAYHFVTDANGTINVKGLDTGTYRVYEVNAPSGYSTVNEFTFTITPTIDQTNQTVTLSSTLSTTDADHVKAGLVDASSTKGDNVLTMQENSGVTDNKTVNITVGDVKSVGLPLTGQAGVTLTWIAGGTVLAIGLAHLIRSRKEQNQE